MWHFPGKILAFLNPVFHLLLKVNPNSYPYGKVILKVFTFSNLFFVFPLQVKTDIRSLWVTTLERLPSAIKVSCFHFLPLSMSHIKKLIYSKFRFIRYFCKYKYTVGTVFLAFNNFVKEQQIF